MYSAPAPAVQPTSVLLPCTIGAPPDALISPKAAPPVTNHNRLPAPGAQPRRPRTVPCQLLLTLQRTPTVAPAHCFDPPMPVPSISPSKPQTKPPGEPQLKPAVPPPNGPRIWMSPVLAPGAKAKVDLPVPHAPPP